MNNFIDTYINIINESNYDFTEGGKFTPFGSYKNINIYINLEHVKANIASRYTNTNVTVSHVVMITKKFIKKLLEEHYDIATPTHINHQAYIPFTIKGTNLSVYIAGCFKSYMGMWRCCIRTLLPSTNPYISKDDLFREING